MADYNAKRYITSSVTRTSLGTTYIQLDPPHYALLLDPATRGFYESQGWTTERYLERGIEMDNAVIGDFPGVTFGLHLCRGNAITPADQERKLRRVVETARRVWGEDAALLTV